MTAGTYINRTDVAQSIEHCALTTRQDYATLLDCFIATPKLAYPAFIV